MVTGTISISGVLVGTVDYVTAPPDMIAALQAGGPENIARWNAWLAAERAKPEHHDRQVGADLHMLTFRGTAAHPLDLTGIDLSYCKIGNGLDDARIEHVQLTGANLERSSVHSRLAFVDASRANLRGMHYDGTITDSHFDGADSSRADLNTVSGEIRNSSFRGVIMDHGAIRVHSAESLDFTGAQLTNIDLHWDESLRNANFQHAAFMGVNVDGSEVLRSNFDSATFDDGTLYTAGVHFDEATLATSPALRANYERIYGLVPTPEVVPNSPAETADPPALFHALLQRNPGFSLGDFHDDNAPKSYIASLMPQFARDDVRVMFVEGFIPNDDQPMLDRFNARRRGADRELFDFICAHDVALASGGYEAFYHMLESARANGILVMAMEDPNLPHETNDHARLSGANPVWAQEVRNTMARLQAQHIIGPNDKYFTYSGGGHTWGAQYDVGVDTLLGIPSTDFADTLNVAGVGTPQVAMQQGLGRRNADAIVTLPADTTIPTIGPNVFLEPARVYALVRMLRDTGFAVPFNSGSYDAPLAAAIRRFEARYHLPVDGIADSQMQAALRTLAAETYLHRLGEPITPNTALEQSTVNTLLTHNIRVNPEQPLDQPLQEPTIEDLQRQLQNRAHGLPDQAIVGSSNQIRSK